MMNGLNFIHKILNKNIIKASFWLLFARIYSLVVSTLTNVLMVRYLGPEKNGIYSYVISFVTLFSGISTMGLDNILTKELKRGKRCENEIQGSAIIVRLIGTATALIILVLCIPFTKIRDFFQIVVLFALIQFSTNVISGITSWHYANDNAKYISISQVIAHTTRSIVTILFILQGRSVSALLFAASIEPAILITIQWLFYYSSDNRISLSCTKQTIIYYLKQGAPIIIGSVATAINLKIDQIMVGNMLGNYELGIYSVAARIAELWYFIPTTLAAVLLPRLAELRYQNEKEYTNAFQKSFSWLTLFAYLTSLITVLFAGKIITKLFGVDYNNAIPIIWIYTWASLFINMSCLRGNWTVIEEKTKYSLYSNLFGAVINVILNLIMIPQMGAMGAAFATLISYMSYGYISNFLFKEMRDVAIMQTKSLWLKDLI